MWSEKYCAEQHSSRIRRAFQQPLQLMLCRYFDVSQRWLLHVSSASGSGHYELSFNKKTASCSCPDFTRRKKPCKHMLCVVLRIIKLKDDDFDSVKNISGRFDDITNAFLRLFGQSPESHMSNEESKPSVVAEAPSAPVSESATLEPTPAEEEMCLICLLELVPTESTARKCLSHCKRWLGHINCLDDWFKKSNLCPLCKGPQRLTSSCTHPRKRARYDIMDNIDLEVLQSNQDDNDVPRNAFFEIIHE